MAIKIRLVLGNLNDQKATLDWHFTSTDAKRLYPEIHLSSSTGQTIRC
ncbi:MULTISPECIES: hypothetical protein [Leptolyngbya]|jgi:hypothetical protein|uniref:Uncharacterized protein n=1 Tax=Leptolyngbya boryana NIES-2135 TaxID=1973484 RepID=A0A1Z4JL38_LEPBY|nr:MULTISPECIES: hypothetical protein [Leptolyngbya]BAY57393.1 hypothetical protein NIES2135_42580 [Leptolyngbya boryana NIES-2135]MBD1859112.1 hypothetical protein [Leptolyngbya sp. FACHB-1624]MBD2368667.1 hypothetical protein [Leptolyngbya sp. FACHB-161]MBD2375072.1 hypothetical protein [Leptolyngbya sp. FACHB-238]MBD2399491.1 hypothetical protein [Leptolyngbya sp. FACHB-239]